MSRYTTAYRSFVNRIDEIELLRKAAKSLSRTDQLRNRRQIDALCRGAIVLLSSHVEAFVKELGEVALDAIFTKEVDRNRVSKQLFYHVSKELLDAVIDARNPETIAERTFYFVETDVELWSKVGKFPRALPTSSFNKGFSNPKFDKVRSYYGRFGYSEYKHELQSKLQAKAAIVVNTLDHLVDTRNSIAHGDPSASKTPDEIGEMIALITLYCRTTDSLFANWCQRRLCGIRN